RLRLAIAVHASDVLRERGVAHQVPDASMAYQSGVVEEDAVLDTDQIRDLRPNQHAGAAASRDTWRDCFPGGDELVERHGACRLIWIIWKPRRLKLSGEGL